MSMLIEPASIEDCGAIAQVHVASWQKAYEGIVPAEYLASLSVSQREASWRQIVSEGLSELLVARFAGNVAGFVSYGPSRDADARAHRGELWAIYASPDVWSKGVGLALWKAARQNLSARGFAEVSLWVIAGNERAIRFYEAAGFQPEPGSAKEFELGGARLQEVRFIFRGDSYHDKAQRDTLKMASGFHD